MSRSYHRNRRHLDRELLGFKRPEELDRIREELSRKRRVKRRVRAVRSRPGDLPPAFPDSIEIHVRDVGPFVHYPATADDLRAVMRRLPHGTLDGLARITLCLGAEHQEDLAAENESNENRTPDPLAGRLGWQSPLPLVYVGCSLGCYYLQTNSIELYAYVYDEAEFDQGTFGVYLRLRMLQTFLHELAHHYFHVDDDARGRRDQLNSKRREDRAEELAACWVADFALPFLEETYPEQLAAFRGWLREHCGIEMPLVWFASAYVPVRGRVRSAAMGFFGAADDALEELALALHRGENPLEARVEFARNLHYGEFYDEALQSLDSVLATEPEHDLALTLQADIYVHQERWEEAERVVRPVLGRSPQSLDAWDVLSDVVLHQRRWEELWDCCRRGIEQGDRDEPGWAFGILFRKALAAALDLDRCDELQPLFQACGDLPETAGGTFVWELTTALTHWRRGDHQRVLDTIAAISFARPPWLLRQVLVALALDSGRRVGSSKGEIPTARAVELLRWNGFDRLAAAIAGHDEPG